MDKYENWSHAITSYFVEGIPRGTGIFLSIDDDVLMRIGHDMNIDKNTSSENFCSAVNQRVFDGDRVNLSTIHGHNKFGEPMGVAFLASMVLAASHMAESDLTSHSNYFRRLREVLLLPSGDGRPRGMDTGIEETLWQEWSQWLQEKGFLPTAYSGQEGATKFINYPLSQALLRLTDKKRLLKLFEERRWPSNWDEDTLLFQIQKEITNFSSHLRQLLNTREQRYQAVKESIYDFYEIWHGNSKLDHGSIFTSRIFQIQLGLYRTEDYFRDEVKYYLYPKAPRRHHVKQLQANLPKGLQTLLEERPGWYAPIGPIEGEELDQGCKYTIEQPANFETLVFPKSLFWILTPDPENPDSEAYATWESPSLGIPFIILCQKTILPQLKYLRDERLIEWDGDPQPLSINRNWAEINQCMIILQEWSGVHIENQQLYDALLPKQSINISISGGLRAPKLSGWIEGYGPQITIFGFEPLAEVQIIRVTDNVTVINCKKPTNKAFSISWPHNGYYRVEASYKGEKGAARLVRIVPWDQLTLSPTSKIIENQKY